MLNYCSEYSLNFFNVNNYNMKHYDSNQQEKIKNFQIMTDTNNEQIALEYLSKNNWDESV